MKKILCSLSILLLLSGCGENLMNTPTKKVEAMLNNYQTLNDDVVSDLDNVLDSDMSFDNTQSDRYRDVMKKHYQNLTYEIKDEKVDGEEAIVTVEIEVTDFSKINDDASSYYEANADLFKDDDGNIVNSKLLDYKLDLMEKANDKVKYTLDINVKKIGDEWQVQPFTSTDLDKINGTHRY